MLVCVGDSSKYNIAFFFQLRMKIRGLVVNLAVEELVLGIQMNIPGLTKNNNKQI